VRRDRLAGWLFCDGSHRLTGPQQDNDQAQELHNEVWAQDQNPCRDIAAAQGLVNSNEQAAKPSFTFVFADYELTDEVDHAGQHDEADKYQQQGRQGFCFQSGSWQGISMPLL
jgi:hypothetical protein